MSFQDSRSDSRPLTLSIPRYLKILPVALGVALGIGTAYKVSANAPTVYGKINITLDQFDYQGAARSFASQAPAMFEQWELNSNASRLGVKGELALEGTPLTVVYLAEYETDADDGANNPFTQRNIYAGLQGRFGRVIGGKFDTPLKAIEGKIDQFNDLKADIDVLIGGQNRTSNIVQYSTPKFGKLLTANLAFIAAEGTDVDLDGEADDGLSDTLSASLVADNGTFYTALAYDENQQARRSLDGLVRADVVRAVVGAKFGALELGALVQRASGVTEINGGEDTSYLVSGAWTSGKLKLKAQYGIAEAKVSDEQGRLAALGADYNLGAKTKVFTYFSRLDVDDADLIDNTFALGFDHSF